MKKIILILSLSSIFSVVLLFSFAIECKGQSYDKCFVKTNGKMLFVANDSLAYRYLNDILGTWDDGAGTKIRIYITDKLISEDRYVYVNYDRKRADLHIAAEVEYYSMPYLKEEHRLWKKRHEVKSVEVKSGWNWDKIVDNSFLCYIQTTSSLPEFQKAESFDYYNRNKRVDYWRACFACGKKTKDIIPELWFYGNDSRESYHFKFLDGYLADTHYPDKPNPLKRTSTDRIIFDNIESGNTKGLTLKISSNPNEIKPDGQSKTEIEAVLYEYTEGDLNSSKPLAKKKITFRIEQQYGIIPGSLSTTEAYTDANGKVKIQFTAPSIESISDKNILSSSIVARCDELNAEEIAYIRFTFDRGEVNVEPNPKGVVSKYGIVPTDKRFPALIHAFFEDANGQKKPNSKVTFTISGNKTYGILKVPGGQEGKSVTVISDAGGNAEVLYYYNSDSPPDGPAMETIDIKSVEMGSTMKAFIYLGFDFSISKVESGYEGKGIINAGEEIPIKITIRDTRYPDLDISRVIDYWGLGGNSGDTRLNLKLEIKPKGEVPDYLLDKLKLQKYPQPSFSEEVDVKTFGDVKNLLYVKESSLYHKKGYPCVKPTISGQTNYEIKISLVDNDGKVVSGNPNSSYISLQTGQPADAFSIFLLDNPFGPNTDEAVIGRIILDLAGFGIFLNLVDGFEAINKGDYLFFYSMVAGKFIDKVVDLAKNVPGLSNELAEAYSVMTEGEKYGSLVFGQGVLTSITDAFVGKIASFFTWGTGKLILLHGEGSQSIINPKTGLPVAAAENSIRYDKDAGTISIKHGTTSIYFIPQDFEYKYENVIKSIEKPVTKGGKITEKEKTKEKEKPKEKEKTKEKEKEKKTNLFSGSWETTDFGTVSFIITGSDVVATCTKNLAGMKGKLSSDGTKITGSWAKFPTYSSPNDAGKFEITVSADGKSFTGKWGNGTDSKAKMDKNLNGKKK